MLSRDFFYIIYVQKINKSNKNIMVIVKKSLGVFMLYQKFIDYIRLGEFRVYIAQRGNSQCMNVVCVHDKHIYLNSCRKKAVSFKYYKDLQNDKMYK